MARTTHEMVGDLLVVLELYYGQDFFCKDLEDFLPLSAVGWAKYEGVISEDELVELSNFARRSKWDKIRKGQT